VESPTIVTKHRSDVVDGRVGIATVADVQVTSRKGSSQPLPRRRTMTTMSRADGLSPEVDMVLASDNDRMSMDATETRR